MKELIEVFRMNELTNQTRINLIIRIGKAINDQNGANLTEPVVYELVKILDPTHKILEDEHYLKFID